MTPAITAYAASPDRGRGLARDMQVRWAFEEVGQPYDVVQLAFAERTAADNRALSPFGQIPSYRADEVTLFESGAIVLHIAERHPGLLPLDPSRRARAIAWMFAAVSTVDAPVMERAMTLILERDKPWMAERLAMLDARVDARLCDLGAVLAGRDWLEGDFSAGDLMMIGALRRLAGSDVLGRHPAIGDYIARGEVRPAFQRAFAAQRAAYLATAEPTF